MADFCGLFGRNVLWPETNRVTKTNDPEMDVRPTSTKYKRVLTVSKSPLSSLKSGYVAVTITTSTNVTTDDTDQLVSTTKAYVNAAPVFCAIGNIRYKVLL